MTVKVIVKVHVNRAVKVYIKEVYKTCGYVCVYCDKLISNIMTISILGKDRI